MRIRKNVKEFHEAGNQPVLDKPQIPPEDRVILRGKLITEEYFETMEALFPELEEYFNHLKETVQEKIKETNPDETPPNIVELADGLGDLDYVVEGTRLEFGINGEPVGMEIQRSNMAKFGPGSWIREDGKVMKPPDWTAPDIEGELKKQGWVNSNVADDRK